jgi:pimeloyl-ACP methyl ester carboxylesterase
MLTPLARSRNPDFAPLSRARPDLTVMQAVQWQLRNHRGFVPAFLSSIRFAPITGQEASWRRLRDAGTAKILLVAGREDPIVLAREIREDAEALLGEGRVVYREVDAAHDFPITDSAEVVGAILEFWERESGL